MMASTGQRRAKVFPPGEFIRDELEARGWSVHDLAERMGGKVDINYFCIDLAIYAPTWGMTIGDDMAAGLARAFDTSADLWLSLDRAWQEWHPKHRKRGARRPRIGDDDGKHADRSG